MSLWYLFWRIGPKVTIQFLLSAADMILNMDSLLPYLTKKVRAGKSDSSRHFICPECTTRTKLNRLSDGRRKCTICGKKFRIHKITEQKKLKECSQILLCFCLDFSPQRARFMSKSPGTVVTLYYDHFRALLQKDNALHEVPRSLPRNKSIVRTPLNNLLAPDLQAKKIIDLMPADFLSSWFPKA
jgi:ribosomal protein L37AE/L43A